MGEVIVPTQDYRKQQLVKGQQYKVTASDIARNRLIVKPEDRQPFEIDSSRCDRKTVYQPDLIPIALGDQLR